MPECSWQQLQPPQWSHDTYASAVPGLTAAVAAACAGQFLDQQASLQELGKIFSTCSTGTGCNSSVHVVTDGAAQLSRLLYRDLSS